VRVASPPASRAERAAEIVVVRHGETEWSRTGRHTGRTDVPLTDVGRREAERLREWLAERAFALVLTSPLQRASETARLAGFPEAERCDALVEWDYGLYEGRTTPEIRREVPGWTVFRDGAPGGESAHAIGARADAAIARAIAAGGDVLLFAHAHLLRVLAARWLGLSSREGRLLVLGTARAGVLGVERETRVLLRWGI
jgi:broad specificity phosphatase PhoE